MKQDLAKRIANVIVDLVRGLVAELRREICCPRNHFAGLR